MERSLRIFFLLLAVSFDQLATAQFFIPDTTQSISELSRKPVLPLIYYSNPDQLFVGIRFRVAKGTIKGDEYGMQHTVTPRYSISQNAFSIIYEGRFHHLIGQWDLTLAGYYDWVVWTNFFGLGNDTRRDHQLRYYRLSTNEYSGIVGIDRVFGNRHMVEISGRFRDIEVLKSSGDFVMDNYINDRSLYFNRHTYAEVHAGYAFQKVDNIGIPQRGVMCYVAGSHDINMDAPDKTFDKVSALVQVYIPLFNRFSLAVRTGGSAVFGSPEFYEYASVGGPMTLRGYYLDRFWGNEAFYDANELRYIMDMSAGRYYGKIGFFALFDDGRVWLNGENSSTLHTAYGAGFLIAPFNKFTGLISYAVSPEGGLVQIRLNKLLSEMEMSRTKM